MGTLHKHLCTFMIISRWILLRMRNVSDKSYRENRKSHLIFSNFFPKPTPFFEIMWKNIVVPDRTQTTVWSMCIACWIPKARNVHSEYVILIPFPRQQCLHERDSVVILRCLSYFLLKLIICTYKVYIRNTQSSLLHVSVVDRHLQGATLETCMIWNEMNLVTYIQYKKEKMT